MADKIRVLLWSDAYWPAIGGIEVLTSNLVPALVRRGFEFLVVTSHNGDSSLPDFEIHDGIPIHRFRFHEALSLRRADVWSGALSGVKRMKSEFRPHLVHLNFPAPSGLFHLMSERVWSAPTIASIHTAFPPGTGSSDTLTHRILTAGVFITANSEAMLRQARLLAPEINERSMVIYNGVAASTIQPTELPFDPPVVLCIARLVAKKGVDVALHAFTRVQARLPEARMIVAGDGPERQSLEHFAAELRIADRVEFRGWVQPLDIPAAINSATLLVVPSRSIEPFGIVAVEAMHMARPVICTDQGGLPEIVEDARTGFTVPVNDPDALAERMLTVLGDSLLARRLGHAGRKRAAENFTIEKCADAHERLYRRTAGARA